MARQTVLPRWRGFNLLGMFLMSSPGRFDERDFQMISDLGFDFVRLPLNYTFWIDFDDPFAINLDKLAPLDQAIVWGEKYGLHVNVALHRAPGFSVARDRAEPFDLWRDAEALEAFKLHWTALARRYRDIGERVSFNLVNEPAGVGPGEHARVMRKTVSAIREVDPARLIILDGLHYGNVPMPDLGDLAALNVAQSCRAYVPAGVSHYRADWVDSRGDFPPAAWPGGWAEDGIWDRERLYRHYAAWAAVAGTFGMGVHCGEGGCFSRTPHDVTLRWMEDVLDILGGLNIGYALWNFRGPFGILDSGRGDVAYEDYKGFKLDRKMLELLRKY
ncbi:MAG: cellulase family glycosylhydrolase [Clostridiales bacterium]|nr:cellulase family glycosylhydrolase [Clostridiales bacterium]